MKTLEISDELYDELKAYVVDPFEDTAEIVIGRLVQIANKAKQKCAPLEPPTQASVPTEPTIAEPTMADRTRISYDENQYPEQSQQVVL